MRNCIYFADNSELSVSEPVLLQDWGFNEAGLWRPRAVGTAAGVIVDDRWLPSPRALDRAEEALRAVNGAVVCDFERPPEPLMEQLLQRLPTEELVVPPSYSHLPHGAVLVGPYLPGVPFRRWLAAQRAKYGPVVLDGAPIRHLVQPGCLPIVWKGPLPDSGLFNSGAVCLTCRRPEGFLFWDDRNTLRRRCGTVEGPVILLQQEWERLLDMEKE